MGITGILCPAALEQSKARRGQVVAGTDLRVVGDGGARTKPRQRESPPCTHRSLCQL